MNVGIYVRVSTEEQRDFGYSIDAQIREINEYCEKRNLRIIDTYNDAGHSAKDELANHLISVSKDAENLLNNFMGSYRTLDEKISEKSKEINQLEWVKLMNNYKNITEEIVLKELIYTENV